MLCSGIQKILFLPDVAVRVPAPSSGQHPRSYSATAVVGGVDENGKIVLL
jgi:hypothetical protein